MKTYYVTGIMLSRYQLFTVVYNLFSGYREQFNSLFPLGTGLNYVKAQIEFDYQDQKLQDYDLEASPYEIENAIGNILIPLNRKKIIPFECSEDHCGMIFMIPHDQEFGNNFVIGTCYMTDNSKTFRWVNEPELLRNINNLGIPTTKLNNFSVPESCRCGCEN
jgi:hypothetical protein